MKLLLVLLVTFKLCWTIRVPVTWDESESAETIKQSIKSDDEFSVETFKPTSGEALPQDSSETSKPQDKPIPVEYFDYTAKKPQFAVDVAAFHDVQSPENHYKAYPIKPYNEVARPELGKHYILDSRNTLHKPFQDYTKINEDGGHAAPVLSSYEVFHPYQVETPALHEIYKDPVLMKIRNDLENSKNRLQRYEKEAGEPDIAKDEYLESPHKTGSKLFQQRHRPVPFEIHRPQKKPIYYRAGPVYKSREQYLNHKLRSPWNHNIAKIRPMHYHPIQNHIHHLRQSHALKYDDERNEYPQVQVLENYSDPKDGYDIYERGKDKFVRLRNNVDESLNNAYKKNHPVTYQKLEMQNNDSTSNNEDDDDDEEEFVPIKNYAQVRKTESFSHLPRVAALHDAETFDEIKNAPRLREAVKSTKAQTVYSEEGYEDAAYDHAGEHKHASENEGHGGFLKENELSGGKFKTPSLSANYKDGAGSIYEDKVIHAEKWKDNDKKTKDEINEEDYSEDNHEEDHQSEIEDENHRNKRENNKNIQTLTSADLQSNEIKTPNTSTQHDVNKREANFQVPQVDLSSTFFNETEFSRIANLKIVPQRDTIKEKYPYYFKNLKALSRNSPLRYAEDLKLIPKKSKGGTEFYDSRSKFECPEVEDVPDPIPEKYKGDGHPDEKEGKNKGDENYDTTKKQPRLNGLGDKIDCFKAKYFGENPLDSPFFKEDIISNPEPIFWPSIATQKRANVLTQKGEKAAESKSHNVYEKLQGNDDLFDLIERLKNHQNLSQSSNLKTNKESVLIKEPRKNNNSNDSQLADQSRVYNDVIDIRIDIKNGPKNITNNLNDTLHDISNQEQITSNNITYIHYQNKEDIMKSPLVRKRRAMPFVYEPYKIIRGSAFQDDTKKSNTMTNISPLIKQIQSSKVIDKVTKQSPEEAQHVIRNVNSRTYKDIGRKDREIKYGFSKNDRNSEDSEIVDVNVDKRRGEPRYEIKHVNHKSKYTPVSNTKSMTKEDYEAINDHVSTAKLKDDDITMTQKTRDGTKKSHFDISKFSPHITEVHNTAASNSVRKTAFTTTSSPKTSSHFLKKSRRQDYNSGGNDNYEEYDDDEEEEEEESEQEENNEKDNKITTTSTTTPKPVFQRKIHSMSTTEEPLGFINKPRLKLVTRFRDYNRPKSNREKESYESERENQAENLKKKKIQNDEELVAPKYREKKKKVSKSTLVTDTKMYGDAVDTDDDLVMAEVDTLIGVKHDMDDFTPIYEKNEDKKSKEETSDQVVSKESLDTNEDDYIDEDEDDENDSDEDDEKDDDENEDDDDDDSNISAVDGTDENIAKEYKITTPEPTKQTLVITTDTPTPTTASRSAKLQAIPVVTRKKIEIHKELPVNKSSPHITLFKQDIKEIEIIKESQNPLKGKQNKNVHILDIYKDDNLAKDINKLGVEIFKENLDLRQGPKHGGNYRIAERISTVPTRGNAYLKKDAETSQSEYTKHRERDDLKSSKILNSKNNSSKDRNTESIELSEILKPSILGGNLRQRRRFRNNNAKSQKLIELDEEHEEDDSSSENSYHNRSRNERPMHGGNYRSARIIEDKQPDSTESKKAQSKYASRNAALILNTFVQAAPVLTTTPGYIKDPSKRKYYYVDT